VVRRAFAYACLTFKGTAGVVYSCSFLLIRNSSANGDASADYYEEISREATKLAKQDKKKPNGLKSSFLRIGNEVSVDDVVDEADHAAWSAEGVTL